MGEPDYPSLGPKETARQMHDAMRLDR